MARLFNLKTVAAVVLALAGVLALYPDAIRLLPYLILLACPLSMFFMHGSHGSHAGHAQSSAQPAKLGDYVCPTHEEIRSTFAGECPVCGMNLEPAHALAVRS